MLVLSASTRLIISKFDLNYLRRLGVGFRTWLAKTAAIGRHLERVALEEAARWSRLSQLVSSKLDLSYLRRLGVGFRAWRATAAAIDRHSERAASQESARLSILSRTLTAAAARVRRSRADMVVRSWRLWSTAVQELVKRQGIEVSPKLEHQMTRGSGRHTLFYDVILKQTLHNLAPPTPPTTPHHGGLLNSYAWSSCAVFAPLTNIQGESRLLTALTPRYCT